MNPILGAIAGPVVDLIKTGINAAFPDKTEQEKAKLAHEVTMATLAQSGKLEEMKTSISSILAEANSTDPWTSRARPSFMYVMYVMILAAIPMGVLFAFIPDKATAIIEGMKAWLQAIPDELYTLFGVGYLGYTGFRGLEKIKGRA